MPEQDDDQTAKSPSQKLAELVARRKAEAGRGGGDIPGKRQSERGAAAFAASRSKPASRK
jgi:hypothetical protein